jgi:hypothetical protein
VTRSWHSARAAPPTVAARTRIVSAAGIRLDHRKSVRPFKGIICNDISEFESYMPSHAVGLHAPVLFGTCHHISQGGAAPEGRPAAFMPAPVTRTTFLQSSLSLQRQPASVSAIAYSISSMSSGTRTPAVHGEALERYRVESPTLPRPGASSRGPHRPTTTRSRETSP